MAAYIAEKSDFGLEKLITNTSLLYLKSPTNENESYILVFLIIKWYTFNTLQYM